MKNEEYICLECNKSFTQRRFILHLKEHGLNKNSYIKKYPNSITPVIKGLTKEKQIEKYGLDWFNEKVKKRKFYNSLEGYVEKYGEIEGTSRYKERYEKSKKSMTGKKFDLNNYINLYGEIEGTRRFKQKGENISKSRKEKKCGTKEWYINKYGNKNGLIEWKKYHNKLHNRHTLEGFIERYGEDGKIKFDNFVDKSKISIENFIKRYGEELGLLKWKKYKNKLKNNNLFSFGYWLKKYNNHYEVARQKYKEFQTRDLNWFVNKYGEEIGNKKYEDWIVKSRPNIMLFSKISQDLFEKIDKILTTKIPNEACYYFNKNKEFKINRYNVDFLFRNKVIEFYGIYFHMKPSIFSENDFNKVIKLTASEIWDKDSKRMRIIENEGYKTLVIWEDDYFKNREIIVNKCIDFLVKEE